ncbi:hypothetical protein ACL9RL_00805 [Plantibacter sp. Mn2098]|uniref:hypothetical protein n=1 Tax=Plantibacter sp. Mn2098 TaxID=3395266 RepID=UPI003BC273D5
MSDMSKEEQARFAQLSDWAESDAVFDGMTHATVQHGDGDSPGRALLAAALGSESAVDRALGRPTLDQGRPSGVSPVRHVRLPVELDEALKARAAAEHAKPSEIVRAALVAYLKAS